MLKEQNIIIHALSYNVLNSSSDKIDSRIIIGFSTQVLIHFELIPRHFKTSFLALN